MLTGPEVSRHSSKSSCWVICYGQVYDVTDFLGQHPGGAASILKYAGKDAHIQTTEAFDPIHPQGTLASLRSDQKLGPVDESTLDESNLLIDTNKELKKQEEKKALPISAILNVDDFEENAQRMLSERAWAYFSSAADAEVTCKANNSVYGKVFFRPRILRNVSQVRLATSLLGHASALPLFVSPAALARLSHPDGEVAIARACGSRGCIQVLSQHASMSVEQVAAATKAKQPLFFQLYCYKSDEATRENIRRAKSAGCAAIWVTVDTASNGIRTRDERFKNAEALRTGQCGGMSVASQNAVNQTDKTDWQDLTWIRKEIGPTMPIVLKGIQCVEDARLAYEANMNGIVISNHGGRNLDYSQPSLIVLMEIATYAPKLIADSAFEIYIDGGIRKGTDIIKALCLGANAVGIGRPPLYALASYGQKGVEVMFDLFRAEMESAMRLLGVTDVRQLGKRHLNTRLLERDVSKL